MMTEARYEQGAGLEGYGRKCASYAPGLVGKTECMATVASWAWNCGTGAFKVSRLRTQGPQRGPLGGYKRVDSQTEYSGRCGLSWLGEQARVRKGSVFFRSVMMLDWM